MLKLRPATLALNPVYEQSGKRPRIKSARKFSHHPVRNQGCLSRA